MQKLGGNSKTPPAAIAFIVRLSEFLRELSMSPLRNRTDKNTKKHTEGAWWQAKKKAQGKQARQGEGGKESRHGRSGVKHLQFKPCIEMDVDTNDQSKEGVAFFTPDTQIFKMIVVQETVVDTLGGGSGLVGVFPLRSTSWNGSKQADIPSRLGIDDSTVA